MNILRETVANIAWLREVYLNRGMILLFWGNLPETQYGRNRFAVVLDRFPQQIRGA